MSEYIRFWLAIMDAGLPNKVWKSKKRKKMLTESNQGFITIKVFGHKKRSKSVYEGTNLVIFRLNGGHYDQAHWPLYMTDIDSLLWSTRIIDDFSKELECPY